eukprot:349898-Chlamydomonas_euryale.AAC.2
MPPAAPLALSTLVPALVSAPAALLTPVGRPARLASGPSLSGSCGSDQLVHSGTMMSMLSSCRGTTYNRPVCSAPTSSQSNMPGRLMPAAHAPPTASVPTSPVKAP